MKIAYSKHVSSNWTCRLGDKQLKVNMSFSLRSSFTAVISFVKFVFTVKNFICYTHSQSINDGEADVRQPRYSTNLCCSAL